MLSGGKIRAGQLARHPVTLVERQPAEVALFKPTIVEHRQFDMALAEAAGRHGALIEGRLLQIRPRKLCVFELAIAENAVAQIAVREVHAVQVQFVEHAAGQIQTGE